MNMKGSDLLVAALENEGVERIFAVPGEENLDVVESLRNSKIELIITRHEQAAAFMAATYGRLTGKAGVCLSTLGPGALNFSTGAAYALLGAMPLVLITGQKGILLENKAAFRSSMWFPA
jgi:acetolactate synthase I/II/III large subunit